MTAKIIMPPNKKLKTNPRPPHNNRMIKIMGCRKQNLKKLIMSLKKRMIKIIPPIRRAILVFDAVVASIKCVMTSQSFPMLNIL
jgi:hypothetical protein